MDSAPPPARPLNAAAQDGRSAARAGQHWEAVERQVEIVTVSIFDREYRFKSNRPELVREIADLVEALMAQVRVNLPGLPHLTDYPAHVAFSLARELIKRRQEVDDLKAAMARVEDRARELAELIDLSLEG